MPFATPPLFSTPNWHDPRTWPIPVWLWIGAFVLDLGKTAYEKSQRAKKESWPTVSGHIETAAVEKAQRTWSNSTAGYYDAVFGYIYSLDGVTYTGSYRHKFGSTQKAGEYVRDMQGRAIDVSYDPAKSSKSTLLAKAIEAVQAMRPPAPEMPEDIGVPAWSKPLLLPLAVVATLGLSMSVWVHLAAWEGQKAVPEWAFFLLHLGIFVVWLPAFFILKARSNGNVSDLWNSVTGSGNEWLSALYRAVLLYAVLIEVITMFHPGKRHSPELDPGGALGFSTIWIIFYFVGAATLFTAASGPRSRTASERAQS